MLTRDPGGETCSRKEDGVPLRVSAILATVALAVVAAGMSNGAPPSDEATKGDLYLATVDGEIVERLTYEPELWHFAPTWQPLGRRTG